MGLVKLVFQGGAIITNALVQPIFWGSEWNGAALKASADQVTSDLQQLFAGPYMLGLSQYGGIAPASMLSSIFDFSSEPTSPVTLANLGAYIRSLISQGKAPDFRSNDQILYLVFTNGLPFEDAKDAGFHSWDYLDKKVFHFAWVMSPNTYFASHEIIEACTDPEAKGFLQPENGIEVGDICEENSDAAGLSDGINAASYWSNIDGDCILPVRTAKLSVSLDDCHVGPTLGGTSTLYVSMAVEPAWIDTSTLQPLADPHYSWKYDPALVKPLGPTNQSKLQVQWLTGIAKYFTTITVTVTDSSGIEVLASLNITPNTEAEAEILYRTCQVKRYLASVNRIPPFLIHKLGPDPAVFPTEKDIDRLRSIVGLMAKEIEQISSLSKRLRRQTGG